MLKIWNENVCTVYTEWIHPLSASIEQRQRLNKYVQRRDHFRIIFRNWIPIMISCNLVYHNDFCGKRGRERERERGRARVNETFLIYSIHAHIKWFTSNRFCIWLQCYFLPFVFVICHRNSLCLLSNKKRCQHFVSISIYIIFLSFRLLLITNIQSAISREFNHISS